MGTFKFVMVEVMMMMLINENHHNDVDDVGARHTLGEVKPFREFVFLFQLISLITCYM